MTDIQTEFNSTFLDLSTQIAMLCPKSFIAGNLSILKKIITTKPSFVIDIFTQRVLKYKNRFDEGDDDFFLNGDFTNDVEGDSQIIGKIFELRDYWKVLNESNKVVIRQFLEYMFDLSEEYLNLLSQQISN